MPAKKKSSAEHKRGFRLVSFFIIGTVVISAAVLIIASVIFAAVVYIPLIDIPHNYSVSVGRVNDKPRNYSNYSLKSSDAVHGDEEYIDFSMLADKCSFPVTGDKKTLKYKIASSDGSMGSMIIDPEGSCINVNGTNVPIKNGIYMKGSRVLLPYSFLEYYINGITIEKDGRNIKIVIDDDVCLSICSDSGNDYVDISDI